MCVGSLFGGGKQSAPAAPPPPPVTAPPPPPTATESSKGPGDRDKLNRLRYGMASTIKTPMGPKLKSMTATGKETLGA